MAILEVLEIAPYVNLPADSRFDHDPHNPTILAAPQQSFAQIVAQTNAFPKMVQLSLRHSWMLVNQLFSFPKQVDTSCRPFLHSIIA